MSTPENPSETPEESGADAAASAVGDPASAPVVDVAATIASGGSSSLADGEWHRMHPLTPLLKGGITLLVVFGIIVANMRDRIVGWFIDNVVPGADYGGYDYDADPIDWLISNDMILVGSLVLLGIILLLCGIFYIIWRFHSFRITEEHVEMRKGILFRTHRRAPLDRVQGVNLTRPFLARMIGMAKLEVVGAGNDGNVALEYLSTSLSEEVRADILRLASGARRAKQIARGEISADAGAVQQVAGAVGAGITGLIEGVDVADVTPESLVKIPAGRLIGSVLLSIAPWFVLAVIGAVAITLLPLFLGEGRDRVMGSIVTALGVSVPLVIAFVAVTWGLISKSLRYSIAPTPDGVRTTYGLLTTVTETLPPGRVHALEITQPLLWRPFGWWSVRINRLTGASASQQASGSQQQFNTALPVGLVDDVVRVVGLMLPDLPPQDMPLVYEHGIDGPVPDADPYRTIRKGAGWRRPLSWRRHGYALTDFALLVRRGRIWRKVAVFPLARLQGISISQGPIDRKQSVGWAKPHTIAGPISGEVVGIDREALLALLEDVSARAALAAGRDVSHRWAEVLAEHEELTSAAAEAGVDESGRAGHILDEAFSGVGSVAPEGSPGQDRVGDAGTARGEEAAPRES